MFQELGEGVDVIHGEAREALHDGLRRLNSPKPRGDGDYTRSIAAHPPLRVVPQLLYAERKRMEEAMGMLIIRHKVKDYGK